MKFLRFRTYLYTKPNQLGWAVLGVYLKTEDFNSLKDWIEINQLITLFIGNQGRSAPFYSDNGTQLLNRMNVDQSIFIQWVPSRSQSTFKSGRHRKSRQKIENGLNRRRMVCSWSPIPKSNYFNVFLLTVCEFAQTDDQQINFCLYTPCSRMF